MAKKKELFSHKIVPQLEGLAVPIGTLNSDPENARVHPERNIAEVVKSLDTYGQRIPVVVQTAGMIVRAGNARLEAAKQLGWTHVAAVVLDDTDQAAKAYALMDNRSADLAEWDFVQVAEIIKGLDAEWKELTGFSLDDMPSVSPPNDAEKKPFRLPAEKYGVIILCATEDEQRTAYEDVSARYTCRVVNV
jgi:hypothetical protein